MSENKNILILLSGSIAAYKTCFVISQLVQKGHQVRVATTPQTLQFIGAATLEGLSGHPVLSDTFTPHHAMDHIHLARWADLILLCPATANIINKMAHGIADDIVTNLYLAFDFKKPFLIAPAMNTSMYQHPTTQASLSQLRQQGLILLETGTGNLACGEVGAGRLLEPDQILEKINQFLSNSNLNSKAKPKLHTAQSRPKILITSGGTQEPIDTMRVLTNLSTGSTGALLADSFIEHGFEVHFLSAKTGALPKNSCPVYSYSTFQDLHSQVKKLLKENSYHAVIHAAAVSDFHISKINNNAAKNLKPSKKLSSNHKLTLELEPNFKILPLIKSYASSPKPLVIGFKFTSTIDPKEQVASVKKLFQDNTVDYVVHNDSANIDLTKNIHSFTLYKNNLSSKKSKPLIIPDKKTLAKELISVISSSVQKKEKIR